MYYQPRLAKWFKSFANKNGGQEVEDMWNAFRVAPALDTMPYREAEQTREYVTYIERSLLSDQAREGGPLSPEQMQDIEEAERAVQASIWQGEVRLVPASGSKTLADQS